MSSSSPESTSVYDYIVIGAGSGGLASARRAASYGAKVALVEQTAIGGTCVNAGCIPKKIMYHAADIATHLKVFPCYGFGSVGLRASTPSLLASEVEASLETSSTLGKSRKHRHRHSFDQVSDRQAADQAETAIAAEPAAAAAALIDIKVQQDTEELPHLSRRRKTEHRFHIPDGTHMMSELTCLQKRLLVESDIETPISFAWEDLKMARDDYIRRLHGIYTASLAREKVNYLQERAILLGSGKVQLEASGQILTAKKILLATGGRPKVPQDVPGSELGITSDQFFALEHQPKRVAIVGAGYIAVELAGILRSLGSQVHVWYRGDTVLRHFDKTLSERLHEEMVHSGILLQARVAVQKVEKIEACAQQHGLKVTLVKTVDDKQLQIDIEVDMLVWAIGRVPNTEALGLEKAGVRVDAQGLILVDEREETSAASVFAIGDAIARPHLTPVAIAAGRKLADRLFGGKAGAVMDYTMIPSVVFSHPPIATVGLTEAEACAKYGPDKIKVYCNRFTSLYYGLLPPGHRDRHLTSYKLVVLDDGDVDADGAAVEKVVGIHMIGQGSDEILQGFAVAMRKGLTKADLDSTVAIHPTSAEELVTMR